MARPGELSVSRLVRAARAGSIGRVADRALLHIAAEGTARWLLAELERQPPRPAASDPRATEVVLGDERRRLRAPLEVELREDAADVVLDGLVRQEDLGGDLLVRLALGHEEQDLALLGGELGQLIGAPSAGASAARARAPSR